MEVTLKKLLLKLWLFGKKPAKLNLEEEAYTAFAEILGSTGLDMWWVQISDVPRKQQEILALAWFKILEYAERTDTRKTLRAIQDRQDGFMSANCASGEMGTFSRAELCYEAIFPNGHIAKASCLKNPV